MRNSWGVNSIQGKLVAFTKGGGRIVIKGSKTDSPLLLLPKNDQFLKIDHISRVMSLTLS